MKRTSRSSTATTAAVLGLGLLASAALAQQQGQKVLSAPAGSGGDEKEGATRPFDSDFEAFAKEALDRWHVPGVAVAVVDGEDIWAEGYGISSFPSSPVTPSTLFYTGSTTKAFTAAIVSLLIFSGNYSSSYGGALSFQTPLSQLIRDDFVLQEGDDWAAAHLTLEDALSHRTGFPRHDKALLRRSGPDNHPSTVRDVARSLRYLPMAAEPRVTWRYCNLMFMVVSHAIQTLTGQWLGSAMRERIWAPLGMHSTFLSVEEALAAPGVEVARGYYWDYLGSGSNSREDRFVEVPYMNLDVASGAGGIVSNVLDYARWIRCLVHECAVLPKEAHRELKTARMMLPPGSEKGYDATLAYALGWELGTYKGHRVFTHSGGMEAYGAQVYCFPDLKYGVVTLGNTALTSNIVGYEVAWKLINEKIGIAKEERFDWAAFGQEIIDKRLKQADTAIEDLYPERADPALPRALPLGDYVGTYFHPAYQNITIEAIDEDVVLADERREKKRGELKAVRDNQDWQMGFEFRHASGEHWAVVIDFLNTPNMLNGQLARAEFVVGVQGTADQLRVEFLEEGSEGVIVFDRVR